MSAKYENPWLFAIYAILKSLNTIYLTSITQKAQITYKRVLEGAVLAFCGHTWWGKLENPGKTTDLGRATTILEMQIKTLPYLYAV